MYLSRSASVSSLQYGLESGNWMGAAEIEEPTHSRSLLLFRAFSTLAPSPNHIGLAMGV